MAGLFEGSNEPPVSLKASKYLPLTALLLKANALNQHARICAGVEDLRVEVKVAGYTAKNSKDILYPNISSAIRPVPHGPDIPVPLPPESDTLSCASSSTETESPVDHIYEPDNTGENGCFNQSELNDLVRDLNFAKETAELLGSMLKEKKVMAGGTYVSWYRHREKKHSFFAEEENLIFAADRCLVQGMKCATGEECLKYCQDKNFHREDATKMNATATI
ncbi:hypothetical protein ANN_15515 [Periplaneta americana]|uniref:Uncharacterized protein n=1 Tax=Periplaneta americana TaxID=6978 RepID=A0ABQ8SGK4_PERAM|nr:hypothetical protein ANN_15515 [Periplaneta americana]